MNGDGRSSSACPRVGNHSARLLNADVTSATVVAPTANVPGDYGMDLVKHVSRIVRALENSSAPGGGAGEQ